MKNLRRKFVCLPALVLLSACASVPDPAEICTAEWITPRATKAVDSIETVSYTHLTLPTIYSV